MKWLCLTQDVVDSHILHESVSVSRLGPPVVTGRRGRNCLHPVLFSVLTRVVKFSWLAKFFWDTLDGHIWHESITVTRFWWLGCFEETLCRPCLFNVHSWNSKVRLCSEVSVSGLRRSWQSYLDGTNTVSSLWLSPPSDWLHRLGDESNLQSRVILTTVSFCRT